MLALKEPRCHGEEDSVAVVELRPGDLAPQNGQLVAKYHELQVLGTLGAEAEEHNRHDASSQDVDDGQKHESSLREPAGRATIAPNTSGGDGTLANGLPN